MQGRPMTTHLYQTHRWKSLSRAWKLSHPLCEECRKQGIIRAAKVTDHIIPYPVCEDFFDMGNLQSLCEYHNILKGNRDKRLIQQWRRTHPDGRKDDDQTI